MSGVARALVFLVALAIAAWVVVSLWPLAPERAAVAPAAKPVELPYAQLISLADRVKTLQAERRYAEALPGARRLLEQHEMRGHLVSSMLVDYGRMLNNAAFEAGAGAPRSTFERIALEKQALTAAQMALELAKTPRERAEGITLVGLVHEAWGFPYDAYLTYRAGLHTDSTYDIARQHYELFINRLRVVRAPAANGS